MCHCYGKITVELVRIRAGFVRQKVRKLLNRRTISCVNSFDNGRFRGGPADANKRLILVRFVSSKTNSNSPHSHFSRMEARPGRSTRLPARRGWMRDLTRHI